MATRTYLSLDELQTFEQKLDSLKGQLIWPLSEKAQLQVENLSLWLEQCLVNTLSRQKNYSSIDVVQTGSWSRGELTPKSDIDVILLGDEEKILSFIDEFQSRGLKLRYRVPENLSDWFQGVEPFDVLSILNAKSSDGRIAAKVAEQKALFFKRGPEFLKNLMHTMSEERRARNQRYDSIENYLEPNLKYGPGGLRDVLQAIYVFHLFPKKFEHLDDEKKKLVQYKMFLIGLRHKLHAMGLGDLVVAAEQKELALWCGYPDVKAFMRDLQRILSEVSFYTDFAFENAKASAKKLMQLSGVELTTFRQCLEALENHPSVLMQHLVKKKLGQANDSMSKTMRQQLLKVGKQLNRFFAFSKSEDFLVSLFRSGLLHKAIPELVQVTGLVQHDQYHRFSVDAHLIQAIRGVLRVHQDPERLGRLSEYTVDFKDRDWKILLWSALYHDLAKGQGGNHSDRGEKLVLKHFESFGFTDALAQEVAWMVKSHLVLSSAAFRQNPQSSHTWNLLLEKGVSGKRLLRLAIFTAIDIIATNPDAWTSWKEQLLYDLVRSMNSKPAARFRQLSREAENKNINMSKEFVLGLDPELVEVVPINILLSDYSDLIKTNEDLVPLIYSCGNGEHWIRFHRRKDKKGIFLQFVQRLYGAGCVVRQSSVKTFNHYGVYDWFKVKFPQNAAKLRKRLELVKIKEVVVPKVKFDRIRLVSENKEESVISFRGKVQTGVLMAAANEIFRKNLVIKWAKVHNWGRQFEGIFSVKTQKNMTSVVVELRQELLETEDLLAHSREE